MFLDELLLDMCRKIDSSKPENIQKLNRELCDVCDNYYKSSLNETMTSKEIKTILDRTFNLWDSFVKLALKDDDYNINLLGELFSKYTFKMQFLSNDEVAKIYNRL